MGRGRITVTPGFLFLMAWCNYADQQGLLLPALAGCALHELGHLAAIWGLGGSVRRLRLTAVGAEIQMERPMSYPGSWQRRWRARRPTWRRPGCAAGQRAGPSSPG